MGEEQRNAYLDNVRLEDMLPPCPKFKTTMQTHYIEHKNLKRRQPCLKTKQKDESLISGHYLNNLNVKDLQMKTRTWPRSMDWREDYRQFLRRMSWCNDEIFKLFFECPKVRYDVAEQFLRDLQKTVYCMDYSPKDFTSLVSQKLYFQNRKYDQKITDYQTTYANYYNRIQEVGAFRRLMYCEPKPKDISLEEFNTEMRKLFKKYNLTTYFDEICGPALMKAKDGIMPSGPIDKYTLRKH
ncbi:uncharacterized protein LOC115625584 [Scaptodrosophila lebanonensis]|uniref:Uncharacterized protein LOC115625584 n=1 Tax=Drosophila lebanonensis TaxID=7225 RepID=A0A6J2TN36_DROLE|nr:uncharacterized protein LOC115625584 [Scaptodrosophila lebanonensis]